MATDEELLELPEAERRRSWWRGRRRLPTPERSDVIGRIMEGFARAMGTPAFLLGLTVFVAAWIVWNSTAPTSWRFDSADLGFIALTLTLSLQASYAAPMILLAQNRQDDRDRVQIEQDRQRAERNTADLEYLTREVVALRMLVTETASKEFVRSELRPIAEELLEHEAHAQDTAGADRGDDAPAPATITGTASRTPFAHELAARDAEIRELRAELAKFRRSEPSA